MYLWEAAYGSFSLRSKHFQPQLPQFLGLLTGGTS